MCSQEGKGEERTRRNQTKPNSFSPGLPASVPSPWPGWHPCSSPTLPCYSLVLQMGALRCPACPPTAPAPPDSVGSCSGTGTRAATQGLHILRTAASRSGTGPQRRPWASPETGSSRRTAPGVLPEEWTGCSGGWSRKATRRAPGSREGPHSNSGRGSLAFLCGTSAAAAAVQQRWGGTCSWAAVTQQSAWPWGRCKWRPGWVRGSERPVRPGRPCSLEEGQLWAEPRSQPGDKPGAGSLEWWAGRSWGTQTERSRRETTRWGSGRGSGEEAAAAAACEGTPCCPTTRCASSAWTWSSWSGFHAGQRARRRNRHWACRSGGREPLGWQINYILFKVTFLIFKSTHWLFPSVISSSKNNSLLCFYRN